jgi:hypothetical protein
VPFGSASGLEEQSHSVTSDAATAAPSNPRRSTHQTYENTYNLLTTKFAQDPIKISSCVYGSHWIADAGLVDTLWMPLISVSHTLVVILTNPSSVP